MKLSTSTLPLPSESTRHVKLADWVELSALLQKDKAVSKSDVASNFEGFQEDEATREIVDSIWAELQLRSDFLKEKYPFSANQETLTAKNPEVFNWAYIFCLLISYVGVADGTKLRWWKKEKIASLFEELCAEGSKNYIKDEGGVGESLQFGTPRSTWKKEHKYINNAIVFLKEKIKDGDIVSSVRTRPRRRRGDGGDGGLDIVAWRHFRDLRPGKIIILGQCATAKNNYMEKIEEAHNFEKQKMRIHTPHLFGFFLPHLLSDRDDDYREEWQTIANCPSIPFDRIRIALYGSSWQSGEFQKIFRKIGPKLKTTTKHF